MEYQKYISQKKELYDNFNQFIDEENNSEGDFEDLINFLKAEKYEENPDEFKIVLHLINNISNNHHNYPTFFEKIERILSFYFEYIKQSFTNSELFNIFQNNKRILYFLIQNKIIIVDQYIAQQIFKKDDKNDNIFPNYFVPSPKFFRPKRSTTRNYRYYFFMEIKQFLGEQNQIDIGRELLKRCQHFSKEYERNRQKGENESYVCELIRQDLVKEFIIYYNKNNFSLSDEVKESIFETNPLLMKKRATLIEYAAFYGSIQIFQYLKFNGIELTPSLWLYAIHSNNPEIIHLLEENNIKPEKQTFVECLKESIKCHHNNIANYILTNLIDQKVEINEKNFNENQFAFGFHYHNYEFIQNFFNLQFIFYYACLYDYFSIVKLLLKLKKIDLRKKIIFTFIF